MDLMEDLDEDSSISSSDFTSPQVRTKQSMNLSTIYKKFDNLFDSLLGFFLI